MLGLQLAPEAAHALEAFPVVPEKTGQVQICNGSLSEAGELQLRDHCNLWHAVGRNAYPQGQRTDHLIFPNILL